MAAMGSLLASRGARQCASLAWRMVREPLSDALSQQSSSLTYMCPNNLERCVVKEFRTAVRDVNFSLASRSLRRAPRPKKPTQSSSRGRSTLTADSSTAVQEAAEEAKPTFRQLRILALHAAVPMVGFGIMDQTIMIQAGDLIDSTIGMRFALPTLAAAACGQVFSDFAGVMFGGTVEAFASRLGLPRHGLSYKQRELPIAKKWSTIGAALGVVCGCLLAMTQLMVMDLQREEQIQEFDQIRNVLHELLQDDAVKLHADKCLMYFVDHEKEQVWTIGEASSGLSTTRVYVEMNWNHGLAGATARTSQVLNVSDAYNCDLFNPEYDYKSLGRRYTKSVLCVPVMERGTKRVFAVLQFINKHEDGRIVSFSAEDEADALQMSDYLSILRPALQPVLVKLTSPEIH